MFLILNLLWIIIYFTLSFNSPNKDNTNFQILVSFILLLSTLIFANPNSEIVFLFGSSLFILNLFYNLPWILIANSDRKRSRYKIKNITNNYSNSISEQDNIITLIFPWRSYHFKNTTLNPKFIAKYYKLQNKEKRNFFEYVIFTFLKEYFYFKSVKSYYIRKR